MSSGPWRGPVQRREAIIYPNFPRDQQETCELVARNLFALGFIASVANRLTVFFSARLFLTRELEQPSFMYMLTVWGWNETLRAHVSFTAECIRP
jgi:hypothetical protein